MQSGQSRESFKTLMMHKVIRRLRRYYSNISPWHRQLKRRSIELVTKFQVQGWFRDIPIMRPYAYDLIRWIYRHVQKHELIVELGCGIGQNFIELSRLGFHSFLGVDNDEKALACAAEMLDLYQVQTDLRFQDGRKPLHLNRSAKAIMVLNWTYLIEDLSPVFINACSDLKPGGFLIIDIINNEYREENSSQNKVYPFKHSKEEVENLAMEYGFRLVTSITRYYPRFVMYFQLNI
jgi:SAM-dependent methyltransferase